MPGIISPPSPTHQSWGVEKKQRKLHIITVNSLADRYNNFYDLKSSVCLVFLDFYSPTLTPPLLIYHSTQPLLPLFMVALQMGYAQEEVVVGWIWKEGWLMCGYIEKSIITCFNTVHLSRTHAHTLRGWAYSFLVWICWKNKRYTFAWNENVCVCVCKYPMRRLFLQFTCMFLSLARSVSLFYVLWMQ